MKSGSDQYRIWCWVGLLAWLTVGRMFYALHDPLMIMSRYKRGRGRGIVAETIAGGCVPMFPESGPTVPLLRCLVRLDKGRR